MLVRQGKTTEPETLKPRGSFFCSWDRSPPGVGIAASGCRLSGISLVTHCTAVASWVLVWVCPTKATDYRHSDRKGSTSGV